MGSTVINTADAAQYGRNPNGANAARNEWWDQMGNNDADQSAVSGAMGYANGQAGKNYQGANENVGLANNEASGANGHQAGAIGLAGTLARGQAPSAGAYQLQAGLNQGVAQQKSIAQSARGGAAMSVAGANAQANTAALQGNAYTQGGMLRTKDMAAGRGMLTSLTNEQRGQSNQRVGQANEFNQGQQNLADKNALGMGQAAVGFGNVANAQNGQDLQAYNSGMGVVDAQSEAEQQKRLWLANARKQAVSANTQDG